MRYILLLLVMFTGTSYSAPDEWIMNEETIDQSQAQEIYDVLREIISTEGVDSFGQWISRALAPELPRPVDNLLIEYSVAYDDNTDTIIHTFVFTDEFDVETEAMMRAAFQDELNMSLEEVYILAKMEVSCRHPSNRASLDEGVNYKYDIYRDKEMTTKFVGFTVSKELCDAVAPHKF